MAKKDKRNRDCEMYDSRRYTGDDLGTCASTADVRQAFKDHSDWDFSAMLMCCSCPGGGTTNCETATALDTACVCGDGLCEGSETLESCEQDCGCTSANPIHGKCHGNAECNFGECKQLCDCNGDNGDPQVKYCPTQGDWVDPLCVCNKGWTGLLCEIMPCALATSEETCNTMNDDGSRCTWVGGACVDVTIRLVGGPLSRGRTSFGYLQIYRDGFWGSICETGFGQLAAQVACRQMGLMQGIVVPPSTRDNHAEPDTPIWLTDISCTGSESRLEDCQHGGWGVHLCSHENDVGVLCQATEDADVLQGASDAFPAGCPEEYLEDCSQDGDCCLATWYNNDFCDDAKQPNGCDLFCWDNDGDDCNAADYEGSSNCINVDGTYTGAAQLAERFPTSLGKKWQWYDVFRNNEPGMSPVVQDLRDQQHPETILRSTPFTVTDDMTISLTVMGGYGDKKNVDGGIADVAARRTTPSGFVGVAIQNVRTGIWSKSLTKRAKSEADSETIEFVKGSFGNAGDLITIDIIDTYHGYFGWLSVSSVTINNGCYCQNNCHEYSCDFWNAQDMLTTCDVLEAEPYGCDCGGCKCEKCNWVKLGVSPAGGCSADDFSPGVDWKYGMGGVRNPTRTHDDWEQSCAESCRNDASCTGFEVRVNTINAPFPCRLWLNGACANAVAGFNVGLVTVKTYLMSGVCNPPAADQVSASARRDIDDLELCGDGACEGIETPSNCPSDCKCGNGICDDEETLQSCNVDCRCSSMESEEGKCSGDAEVCTYKPDINTWQCVVPPGAASETEGEAVAVTEAEKIQIDMVVDKIDFVSLRTSTAAGIIQDLKLQIAARMGVDAKYVTITLEAGSVRVHCEIEVPPGISARNMEALAGARNLDIDVGVAFQRSTSNLRLDGALSAGDSIAVSKPKVYKGSDRGSLEGDPHVLNMQGEKFDILHAGEYSILQVPRDANADNTFLSVLASIERANKKWCESMFIDKVTITGKWLGMQKRLAIAAGKLGSREPLAFQLGYEKRAWRTYESSTRDGQYKYEFETGGDMPHLYLAATTVDAGAKGERNAFKATIGPINITVSLVQHPHFQFLNLDADGLHELSAVMKIGGILGLDPHADALNPDTQGCKSKSAQLRREAHERFTQNLLRRDGVSIGGLRGLPDRNVTVAAPPEDASVLYDPSPLTETGLGSRMRAV